MIFIYVISVNLLFWLNVFSSAARIDWCDNVSRTAISRLTLFTWCCPSHTICGTVVEECRTPLSVRDDLSPGWSPVNTARPKFCCAHSKMYDNCLLWDTSGERRPPEISNHLPEKQNPDKTPSISLFTYSILTFLIIFIGICLCRCILTWHGYGHENSSNDISQSTYQPIATTHIEIPEDSLPSYEQVMNNDNLHRFENPR